MTECGKTRGRVPTRPEGWPWRAWQRLRDDERGAITVDWVVLTGAVVGLGIAAVATITTGVDPVAQRVGTTLSGASVGSLGTLGQ